MRSFLLIFIFLQLVMGPMPDGAAAGLDAREDLHYQVSLGPWDNVARVHLVLKELKPGHYQAEFSRAAQGMWRLLSRWLPERYQTEMVYRDGRLLPLIYREEFQYQGKPFLKEYHFDYEQGRLTLWSKAGSREMVKEWEAPLKEPVYDLLSLFTTSAWAPWERCRVALPCGWQFFPLPNHRSCYAASVPKPDRAAK